ncbi:MAG: hypothetical protein JW885_02045 [Deltaproteobacteria bacterium]|nr:hypothetical protein [Candidatus Zymogenaceae bacterium]
MTHLSDSGTLCSHSPNIARKKNVFRTILACFAALAVTGCATTGTTEYTYVPPYSPGYGIFTDHIVTEALETLPEDYESRDPDAYWELLTADGRITIALCIGTEDLVNNFYDSTGGGDLLRVFVEEYETTILIREKEITLDVAIVNNKEELITAFGEREVIFVYSHSRYGNGWALHEDGLDEPFRMQSDPISIPKKQLHGYQGEIVGESSSHYFLAPNTEDLDRVVPYPGFQMIIGLSCTSEKHFMKELLAMRSGNPSLMILTTGAGSFLEMHFSIFESFLADLVVGTPTDEMVSHMNDAWQAVPEIFYEEHGIRYNWTPKRVIKFSYSDI